MPLVVYMMTTKRYTREWKSISFSAPSLFFNTNVWSCINHKNFLSHVFWINWLRWLTCGMSVLNIWKLH